MDGFYSNKKYYQDNSSLCIQMNHYQKFTEVGFVENNVGQGKNDYGNVGISYGLFHAVKKKLYYTEDTYGILHEKKFNKT